MGKTIIRNWDGSLWEGDQASHTYTSYRNLNHYPIMKPNVIWDLRIDPDPLNRKEKPMRGLFEVFVVDPETGATVLWERIVAKDEATARLKGTRKFVPDGERDLDDYDVIVRRLGDVREKKQIQEVRIAK